MEKFEIIEKLKKYGNAYYINVKKEVIEFLRLKKDDWVKITIEKVEQTNQNPKNKK